MTIYHAWNPQIAYGYIAGYTDGYLDSGVNIRPGASPEAEHAYREGHCDGQQRLATGGKFSLVTIEPETYRELWEEGFWQLRHVRWPDESYIQLYWDKEEHALDYQCTIHNHPDYHDNVKVELNWLIMAEGLGNRDKCWLPRYDPNSTATELQKIVLDNIRLLSAAHMPKIEE